MKRYILFGFDDYYPLGGMNDLAFDFDTKEEFKKSFDGTDDRYNIYDSETRIHAEETYMTPQEVREWVENNVEN